MQFHAVGLQGPLCSRFLASVQMRGVATHRVLGRLDQTVKLSTGRQALPPKHRDLDVQCDQSGEAVDGFWVEINFFDFCVVRHHEG